MRPAVYFGSKIILLAALLSIRGASKANAQSCQNGGTFDSILFECRCPPTAYGSSCESLFSVSNPCFNLSAAPVLRDATGVHAAGNRATGCGGGCLDYNSLAGAGKWYRIQSPNGNFIVSSYPCTGPIGCGTATPYTLRNVVQEFRNDNGTLYSARAFPFDPSFSGCFSNGALFYSLRWLICPSNDNLYFLTPTSDVNHRYCIGVYTVTTTTSTTTTPTTTAPTTATPTTATPTTATPTTATPTTATPTTATPTTETPTTATPTTTTSTTTAPTTATPTSTAVASSATITKSDASTPTYSNKSSNASNVISRQNWNTVANDSTPYVKVSLNSTTTTASLICGVRSNSARASFYLETVGNPTDSGRAVFCDMKPVLSWLTVNATLYVNCRVEVMDVITEVTVCQIRFNGKEVRYVDNRGQCVTAGFTESAARFWHNWFWLNSP